MNSKIDPSIFVVPFIVIVLPSMIGLIFWLAKNRKKSYWLLQIIFFALITTSFLPATKIGGQLVSFFQLAIAGNIWLELMIGSYLIAFLLTLNKNNRLLKWSMYVFALGYTTYWITLLNKMVIGLTIPIFIHVFLPMIAPLLYWPVFWTSHKLKTEGFNNIPVTKKHYKSAFKTLGMGFLIIVISIILMYIFAPQLLEKFNNWYTSN